MKKILAALIGFSLGFFTVMSLDGCGAQAAPGEVVSPTVAFDVIPLQPPFSEVFMVTKFTIVNDRKIKMNVRIQDVHQDRHIILNPGQFETVEMTLPEGSHLFFKVWESGHAFLSFHEGQ